MVNPPSANKYCFWTNEDLGPTPEEWLSSATQHEGSWWTDWRAWIRAHAGKDVPARVPGKGKLKALADAPGTYVRMRADE
jgi:polyhydroxyalkanoate synthase